MPIDATRSSIFCARVMLAAAAAIALYASPAVAQGRGRIVLSPAVEFMLPGSYYAHEYRGERSQSEIKVRQEPLALVGAQLSYELPGTSWRVGVGYARGQSDLDVYYYYREGGEPGTPSSSFQSVSRYAEPATRELLTLVAGRQLVRGPLASEVSTALVRQRLDAVLYRGFLQTQRIEGRYSDWGMQLGGSVGPSSGMARGLRVGARAHLLRASNALVEEFATGMPDRRFERGVVASLGWRVAF